MTTLYQFSLPITKSVRLEKVFVASQTAGENLCIASNMRDKIMAAQSNNLPQNVISAIEEYVPFLNGLTEQVATSGKVALRISLDMLWSSSLLTKVSGETKYYMYHVFPEEAAHIYFMYGMAHYQLARNIQLHGLEDAAKKAKSASAAAATDSKTATAAAAAAAGGGSGDYRNEVTRLMRTAAGIFQYMAKVLLPAQSDRGSSKPPDVSITTAETLADMCLCHAQEMTIETGLAKGTSESLLAKLALGVSERYASARSNLGRGLGQVFYALDQGWNVFLGGKSDLWAARAWKLQAVASQKAAEHGKSVGYFEQALSKLTAISPPKVHASVTDLVKEVTSEIADTKHLHSLEAADNTKIYFALVPKELSELPMPQSKFMITALEYSVPAANPGPFFTPPPAAVTTAQPNTGAGGGTPQLVGAAVPSHLAGTQPMQLSGGPQHQPPMQAMNMHGGGVMHATPTPTPSMMMKPVVHHGSAPLMPGAMAAVADATVRMGSDWGGPNHGSGAPKPAAGGGGAGVAAVATGSWVCPACTYQNKDKNFCEMCNTPHHPKSASAATAPTPSSNNGGSGPAPHQPPTVLNMTPTPNPPGSHFPPYA